MAMMRPPRRLDPYADQFWEFTKDKDFRLQRCDECGKFRWPPSPSCDRCLSEAFNWVAASGRGRLLSWVVFRRQYFHEYPSGHPVGLVELEEGPLFITIPVDADGEPLMGGKGLAEGIPMEVSWTDAQDEFGTYWLPVFRPANA